MNKKSMTVMSLPSSSHQTRSLNWHSHLTHLLPAILFCVVFNVSNASAQEALWKTYMDAGERAYSEALSYEDSKEEEVKQKRREAYADAEKRFELARREAEAFGPNDMRLAETLKKLVFVYLQQEKYAEAGLVSKKMIAAWGKDSLAVAEASFETGNMYFLKYKYAEAEPFFDRALAIVQQTEKPKSADIRGEATEKRDLSSTNISEKLVQSYVGQKKYAQAEPLGKKLLMIWEQDAARNPLTASLASLTLANLYAQQDKYAESEPFYKLSISILEHTPPGTHERRYIPNVQERLADVYIEQEKYGEAETTLSNAFHNVENREEPDQDFARKLLTQLASTYTSHQKYADAEKTYQLIIASVEALPGPEADRTSLPTLKYRLAGVYLEQEKFGEAESVLNDALQTLEKQEDKNPELARKILVRLGDTYASHEKYSDAEKSYRQVIGLLEELPATAPDRRALPNIQDSLANVYNKQKKYAEAEAVVNGVLQKMDQEQRKDDPYVAILLYRLGEAFAGQRKYGAAEKSYKDAIGIFKQTSREDWRLVALRDLGNLYRSRGDSARAEPFFEEIANALARDPKTKKSLVADYLLLLGRLYLANEKYAEALQTFARARAVLDEQNPKPDDISQSSVRNSIAKVYYFQGKYDEAEPLYLQAIEIARKVDAAKPTTAAWYEKNYALLLYARGDKDRAEPMFQKALTILAQDKDEGAVDVATSWFELAELYRTQGKYAEAAPLFKQALERRTKALEPDHLDLGVTREKYAATLRKLGQPGEAEALEEQARRIRAKHAPQD